MKVEVKKLEGAKREISIEVTGDAVKDKFEEVFTKITQEAKIKGFRPGHAPRDVVEKTYSALAHEQVLKELIPDVYDKAVQAQGLEVIELPKILDVKLDRENLSFKAHVEVYPEIPVKDYKGIKVDYQKIVISPDEIKRNIDSLKETKKIDVADDNFAKVLGYPNLSELEASMERHIFIQKDNLRRQKIENEIIGAVTKGLDFKVPQSLVNRQLEDLLRQAKMDLALKGLPREKIDEQDKKLSEQLAPEAKKQVEVYMVLSAVAKKENIPVDEHMPRNVMEFLLKEADWKELV